MSRLLAIDPGPTESAWAVVDVATCYPIEFGKADNLELRLLIRDGWFGACNAAVVEMVASYGMAVGADVFRTCVWIGRFYEALDLTKKAPAHPTLVFRRDVKLHHCGQTKATDSNIIQALRDRFAPGVRNYGKGTKAEPGWFHGFSADVWQAYALAVLTADRISGRDGVSTTIPTQTGDAQ